jgi:hypothetical protein
VGQFVWDPEHGHWHFGNYAKYELRTLRPDGTPDLTAQGLVAPGQKVSFCVLDTSQASKNPPGYDPLRSAPLYTTCSNYLQGISPGWADEYTAALAGQQILLDETTVADGTYALVVTINPDGRILESDRSDNQAFITIAISAGATKARVA